MRKVITPILIFLGNHCLSQDITVLKLDANLSINIPAPYYINDTLGIKVISATIDSGKIVITKMPKGEDNLSIKSQKDLLDFYEGVKEGLMNTLGGELLEDTIIEISNLKLQKMIFNLSLENEHFIVGYIGFVLNNNKYSIQIMEMESKKMKLAKDVLSSIIFSGKLGLQNQLTE